MKLINGTATKRALANYLASNAHINDSAQDALSMVAQWIDEAPEVEAVQVVRCKDCAQWGGVVFGNVCRRWSAPLAGMKNCTGPEDFCSYGQRKEK